MSKTAYLDALAGLSDAEDDNEAGSSSDSEGEDGGKQAGGGKEGDGATAAPGRAAKRQKQQIDLETLKQYGYRGGPSVLFVPDKHDGEQNWAWGSGMMHRGDELEEETFEEREANRAAVTLRAEESAVYARKAVSQAEQLRQQKREEQQRLKQDKKFSWNQKEKRKRDEGKANRGKNYVEEEKRRAREFGVVPGFD